MTETPHTTPQAPNTPPALHRLGLVFDELTANVEMLYVLEQALHAETKLVKLGKAYPFTVARIRENISGALEELDAAFMQVVELKPPETAPPPEGTS